MRNWKKFSVGWEVGARGVGVHGGDETDATEIDGQELEHKRLCRSRW